MNWRNTGFDWNHARAFLATAEEGSLSAASRVLGQTQPTLGRQVAALEEQLGVPLFERAGRSLVLTQSGQEVLEHVRAMRDAADRVSLTAVGQAQEVEGLIRITAAEVMCATLLPPAILRLLSAAPRLQLEVVAADDLRDLQRREADIAIRHVRPTEPELIARLVQDASARLYAARSYLDKRGRPASTEALTQHDFVAFGDMDRTLEFYQGWGLPLTRTNFRVGSSSGMAGWALVQEGLGISIMSDHVARKAPDIEPVLPEMEAQTFPVWLVSHSALHSSRRIRLVFDLLADFLTEETA